MHFSAKQSPAPVPESPYTLSCGGFALDLTQRRGFAGSHDLGLSRAEFATLLVLASRRGLPLSKDTINAGLPEPVDPRMIDVYVSRLRGKLASAGVHGALLTVPGRGYMAVDSERSPDEFGPFEPPVSGVFDLAMAPA